MEYKLYDAMGILERTPQVLRSLLQNAGEPWTHSNEGPDTFSPYDVVGHLVHGEKTDWPNRIQIILEQGTAQSFTPYDRFAMYGESKGKTINDLLEELEQLRRQNLQWLAGLQLQEADLDREGMHPGLGTVTLRQLLAAWVVHDLTHIAQITRVMAKQYKEAIGPWTEYFRLLSW